MMTSKVVLFGTGQFAELMHWYLSHQSPYEVVGFTVDAAYQEWDAFHGLPVVPFETVQEYYSPDHYKMLVFISFQQVNRLREQKYHEAKAKGYQFITYVSPNAHACTTDIGENTVIMEDNVVQPFVHVGNNVILWSGNHIGHHTTIRDHVFIASHVVVSGAVEVGERTFIGVNATLRDNITIAPDNVIGAGALILKDTAPFEVYVGQKGTKIDKRSDELRGI